MEWVVTVLGGGNRESELMDALRLLVHRIHTGQINPQNGGMMMGQNEKGTTRVHRGRIQVKSSGLLIIIISLN